MSIFQVTYVNPGDKLWFVMKGDHYNSNRYRGDIIVPVVVEEVDEIYSHPNHELPACWSHRFIDSKDNYVAVPLAEKDENGWNKYTHEDLSCLGNAKPVNQFVWIDEPVGHGIQVGDIWDGLFLTLQEAQRHAIPSRKKHLRRRLHAYRNRIYNFVRRTWEVNGERYPFVPKHSNKKVYVRKK